MELEIITTSDGSHSIYVKELDEHYHSVHGAIQESKHVFIEAGFNKALEQNSNGTELNILEIGLGTGLNALLTFIESENLGITINYTAIEAFPVNIDFAEQLNYPVLLNHQTNKTIFSVIHTCEWNKEIALTEYFNLLKIKNTLQNHQFKNNYHLIYFDAFGPAVQPEMWEEELFEKLFSTLLPNGLLVTYCAKGEVKRTLKKAGFVVESLQGPPGKREMIRAIKLVNKAIS